MPSTYDTCDCAPWSGTADAAAALQTLSPEQRAVVELTYYEYYSYQEIAAIMGCPVNTVKTRMVRARRHLAFYLAKMALESADDMPKSVHTPGSVAPAQPNGISQVSL